MTDIDGLLDEMRQIASDPRLQSMDDAVLLRASMQRARSGMRRHLGVTGALALGAGVFVSIVSPQAQAEQASSFNAAPLTAPSYLLIGAR
jgi:hypothetical protein